MEHRKSTLNSWRNPGWQTPRVFAMRFVAYTLTLVFAAVFPLIAASQEDDEELPGTFGEATGMFAQQERDERAKEGQGAGVDLSNTTTNIPPAELKKYEEEVRTILARMGAGFVAGDTNAILALYADDYSYMGRKKIDISSNVVEYLSDYDDKAMDVKKFQVRVMKTLGTPEKLYADASVVFKRTAERVGTSKQERLEKGTPQAVEKMKEDADYAEAGEALEEFYSSQKHPLDTSHVDPTPLGKEVTKDVKANFRLEKRGDEWKIIEAEFGTTRKTVILTPEEKMKKFAIFVPAVALVLFIAGLIMYKLKDMAVTGEEITVKEGEYTISKEYKKELEADVRRFVDSLAKGKHDEEVEAFLKAQRWEDARHVIKDRITIAHELHDRNMGALYAQYEKKILEWETRYANFY